MFLEIKDLKKSFGTAENRTEVLKGIDFSVEKGQICVLLGPSGSGKSTLLNIIGGIERKKTDAIPPPTSGICISDVQSDTKSQCQRKY